MVEFGEMMRMLHCILEDNFEIIFDYIKQDGSLIILLQLL